MKKIKGRFRLIDFSTTHDQFLFRHSRYVAGMNMQKNKDILLEGVKHFNLPVWLDDFQVIDSKPCSDDDSLNVFYFNDVNKQWSVTCFRILYQENCTEGDNTSIPCKVGLPLSEDDIKEMAYNYSIGELEFNFASDWKTIASAVKTPVFDLSSADILKLKRIKEQLISLLSQRLDIDQVEIIERGIQGAFGIRKNKKLVDVSSLRFIHCEKQLFCSSFCIINESDRTINDVFLLDSLDAETLAEKITEFISSGD